MKVIFNETQYEFKTFYSETNGYEAHLFRNDKLISITPIAYGRDNPTLTFDSYVNILKKYVEFDSIQVNKAMMVETIPDGLRQLNEWGEQSI